MLHKIVLLGRVGKDPEMRFTQGGAAVCNFSVATARRVGKEATPTCPSGWKESYNGNSWELTTWWRVTTWRKLAEMCNQYLSKGRVVYIEGEMSGKTTDGSLNPRVWTGSDGVAKASFEVTARTVKFLGGRSEESAGAAQATQQEPPAGFVEENDIPF